MSNFENSFENCEQSLTEYDIAEVELRFDFEFPKDFRDHYLRCNGGSPSKYCYKRDHDIFVIQNFLPIKYGNSLIIEDVYEDLRNRKRILPSFLVPFAIDPGGEFFCISVRSEDFGVICFFHSEFWDTPSRSVLFLSSSLDTFVATMLEEQ